MWRGRGDDRCCRGEVGGYVDFASFATLLTTPWVRYDLHVGQATEPLLIYNVPDLLHKLLLLL